MRRSSGCSVLFLLAHALPAVAAPTTVGEQRVLVVPVTFSDSAPPSMDVAAIQSAVSTAPDSADAFLRENSYGRIWLSATVLPWQTLPNPSDFYRWDCGLSDSDYDVVRLVDPVVDFAAFERLVLVIADARAGSVCGCASMGTMGFLTAEGLVTLSRLYVQDYCLQAIPHELGHNFGLHHAGSATCEGGPAAPSSLLDPSFTCGVPLEWGASGDGMGYAGGHFAAWRKAQLGWLDDAPIGLVDHPGEYLLDQLERPSVGLKALRIALGADGRGGTRDFWIEYRTPGVFDQAEAVQVRVSASIFGGPGDWSETTFRFPGPDPTSDVDVGTGHPFHDPYRGVRIELVGRSGAGAAAQVRLQVELPTVRLEPEGVLALDGFLPAGVGAATVRVRNAAAAGVALGTATLAGRDRSAFALADDACSGVTLAAGGECAIEVAFSTTTTGERLGTLIVPNSSAVRPLAALDLLGTGRDDISPPRGTVTIDGGAAATRSRDVTLTLAVEDQSGAAQMCLANDDPACDSWEPFVSARAWRLSDGDGPKHVFAWFRDRAGNTAPFAVAGAIILDTTAPECWLAATGMAYVTYDREVSLSLHAYDGAGVARMCLGDTAPCTAWQTYADVVSWHLTAPCGESQTISAWFEDGLGNASTVPCTATIRIECPPRLDGDETTADGGAGLDDTPPGGCGCRTGLASAGLPAWVGMALLAAVGRRRARSRRR
jgi:hypothetical protein